MEPVFTVYYGNGFISVATSICPSLSCPSRDDAAVWGNFERYFLAAANVHSARTSPCDWNCGVGTETPLEKEQTK